MADIVKEIEITAALSADYQDAFKAASNIARDSARELTGLTRREADLQKLLSISSKQAEEAAAGNEKAAAHLANEYDKLADKLGLVDRTAHGVSNELKAVGARKKDVNEVLKAAKGQSELGNLSKKIKDFSSASKRIKDPALIKQLDLMKKRFVELGGSIPGDKKLGFFDRAKAGLMGLPGPVGNVAKSFSNLSSIGIAAGIVGIGAAAVSATKKLWGLGLEFAETGDRIAKTSQQIGISSDAFQELSWAVGLGGASEQDLATGLRQLNKQMSSAIAGNASAVKSFKRLGISMNEVRSMNAEEMFSRISDALSGFEDVDQSADIVEKLFGGGGSKLANAIKGGSDALASMRKEAVDAGYVLSKGDLSKAEEVTDNLARAQMQLNAVYRDLGASVLPVVNDLLVDFSAFVKDNKSAIKLFVSVAGSGFRFIGGAISETIGLISKWNQVWSYGLEYWRGAFGEMFAWFSEMPSRIGDAFESAKVYANGLVESARDSLKDLFNWFSEMPSRIGEAFNSAAVYASAWLVSAKDRALSWVSGLVDELKDYILGGFRGVSDSIAQIPLLGRLFDTQGAVSSQGVSITVQNNIDARGATPGAGVSVGRAVSSTGQSSGEAVAAALSNYYGSSYAR